MQASCANRKTKTMKTGNYYSFYTPMGVVNFEHLAHGSVHMEWEDMHIYVDPYSDVFDYTGCRKADMILLTHAHTDHYDLKAIDSIATPGTTFIVSKGVATCLGNDLLNMKIDGKRLDVDDNPLNVDASTNLASMFQIPKLRHCKVITLENGGSVSSLGLTISAVPAYNIVRKRDNGKPFHIKGEGNGYIIAMQDFEIYFAGDTELIPEMSSLAPDSKAAKGGIDVAFLPKNLPYTMRDDEFVEAANLIRPKNLFPIHYFDIDPKELSRKLDTGICLHVGGRQIV